MKLPRLGNPKTIKTLEKTYYGDSYLTEVTYASQFDLMPTWAQWVVVSIPVAFTIILFIGLAVTK